MPSRDVSQLILEVDARIATAQRAVNQLAKSVQQDSASMEQSLGKVAQSHAQLGKALNDNGRVRAGFTQLSFQIGDISQQMSLGVSGARIFAQQSGQVIQALQVMGGEGNKFLQFMGGPWGIAISTAAVILAPLAAGLFDTGDQTQKLVGKMREQAKQAELNDKAQQAWKESLDGAEAAIRDVNKALDALEGKSKTTAQRELEAAQNALAVADAHRAVAAAAIARARAELEVQKAMASGPGQRGEIASLGLEQKFGALNAAEAELGRTDKDIASGRAAVERAQSFVTVEKASASAADKINQRYDTLIEKARKRALAEHKVGDELDRQVAALVKQRDAELKALQSKGGSENRQFGRQIDFGQAEKIARGAGMKVNSGYRSPAEQARLFNDPSVNRPGNPVAAPGTSAHNGANGKWAIDIQITDGVTPGKIRKVFADQGVSLTKVLKEKGHFHVEGSRSEAAKAENDAERAAEKAVRQQNSFSEQSARLDQELLRAKNDLVQGIDGQADAAVAELVAAQDARKLGIQNDVAEGKLSQAQADILKAKVDQVAFEKIKAVEIGRQVQHIQQQDEIDQRTFQYRADDLRFADDMATTQAEHRRLQLEILDVVYQQKEAHLRALKAELEVAGKLEEAAQVQAQLDRLPTEKAHDEARTRKGTMNPLEAWAHEVPKTAAEINEALQSIEARGLDNLSSAITDVIMGTKSLGAAFKDIARSIIADIIQMTIRMLIFKAISGVFGGGGSGDIVVNTARLPGRASGGPVTAGQAYIVGEKGQELFVPDSNGTILPKVPRLGNLTAANSNMGGPIEIVISTAPSDDAWAKVDAVATQRAGQAVQVSVRHTEQTVRTLQRPKLMGR